MNKPRAFGIILAASVLASCSSGTGGAASLSDTVAQALSRKYNRPAIDYVLETQEDTGSFAKGTVRLKDVAGGGLWFAAKTEKGWELAFDGNGIMPCATADRYRFPRTMVSACVDEANAGALVKR
jgi:hypothetical protein